ncbi:hypothetical protein [Kribbella sp. NPDC051770]
MSTRADARFLRALTRGNRSVVGRADVHHPPTSAGGGELSVNASPGKAMD